MGETAGSDRTSSIFGGAAPDFVSPNGRVESWLVEPAGMLSRVRHGAVFTVVDARFMIDTVEPAMRHAFADARRFVYVHDFSGVASYETESRVLLTDWGKQRHKEGAVDQVVMVPPRLSGFVRIGVTSGLAVLRALGMSIDLADDLGTAIAKLGLRRRLRAPA